MAYQYDESEVQERQEQDDSSPAAVALESCKGQLKDVQQKYAYLGADFENYKRRMITDRAAYTNMAHVEVIRKLLPVIDGMERAFVAQKNVTLPQELHAWGQGIELVHQSLVQFLRDMGVQEVSSVGQFDPELHEALSHVDAPGVASGAIVELLQKGYKFKDTVIRHALVSVAR